ncbi:hypothetical protein VNO77_27740 [Canavalia gladiata]|uniref:Uncharacterized protein n=1 Tax=Canavalia gladiata TaxID=3824 RepID=A0AAN9QAS6_CANGL
MKGEDVPSHACVHLDRNSPFFTQRSLVSHLRSSQICRVFQEPSRESFPSCSDRRVLSNDPPLEVFSSLFVRIRSLFLPYCLQLGQRLARLKMEIVLQRGRTRILGLALQQPVFLRSETNGETSQLIANREKIASAFCYTYPRCKDNMFTMLSRETDFTLVHGTRTPIAPPTRIFIREVATIGSITVVPFGCMRHHGPLALYLGCLRSPGHETKPYMEKASARDSKGATRSLVLRHVLSSAWLLDKPVSCPALEMSCISCVIGELAERLFLLKSVAKSVLLPELDDASLPMSLLRFSRASFFSERRVLYFPFNETPPFLAFLNLFDPKILPRSRWPREPR